MDKVNHFEIPYDDRKRAHKFYADVFGWQIKDSGVPGMAYDMAYTVAVDDKFMPKEVGAINGGMMKRSVPGEGPVVVVTVADLAGTLAKVKTRGGTVIADPAKVGDMGMYARVKDSEGNTIGVWQNLKKM